jgi:hypothetical protein
MYGHIIDIAVIHVLGQFTSVASPIPLPQAKVQERDTVTLDIVAK